ncbi:DUF3247 family protein [Xanthomonas translucens]|uniref:Uncharacterized protein n=1 Tax=Xanthomonas translucens pv. translucens DSM 18974 TaxID=1261556 RepID=A0A1C3TSR0_XANCT|nr:DUF3247 family protein [Xanthomonas translucens]MCC8448072.1 DUF3247 family protein [Xanthomonas translucens pv. translucens]MCT8286317.1 DUF3247 family protein [Xanthomonas translucens pv. translucens]MCT8303975.1 DUF3247 family protein [Xanthomonas translucens pv. translucens]MQS43130.1 hypothetical protein [Xanthomonas translucens pv. translucens]UNT98001.1 DUF3247 family protein [Xanthomonas translucens pv. translucens]
MRKLADAVHPDPGAIAALQAWRPTWPDQAQALLRLDDLLHPEQQHDVWLDRIGEVAPLTPTSLARHGDA